MKVQKKGGSKVTRGAREWALGWETGCPKVSGMKMHGLLGARNMDSWMVGIICRLEGCGQGQGQIMKSWHTTSKSLNFVLQTLGVVDM